MEFRRIPDLEEFEVDNEKGLGFYVINIAEDGGDSPKNFLVQPLKTDDLKIAKRIQESDLPFAAFRNGERGVCSVVVNSRYFSTLTVKRRLVSVAYGTDRVSTYEKGDENLKEILIFGRNDEVKITGELITGQKIQVRVNYRFRQS